MSGYRLTVNECKQFIKEAEGKAGASRRGKTSSAMGCNIIWPKVGVAGFISPPLNLLAQRVTSGGYSEARDRERTRVR